MFTEEAIKTLKQFIDTNWDIDDGGSHNPMSPKFTKRMIEACEKILNSYEVVTAGYEY